MRKVFLLLFLIVLLVFHYKCSFAGENRKQSYLENKLGKTISCNFRNTDLKDVLLIIGKQTGIGFVLIEIDKSSSNAPSQTQGGWGVEKSKDAKPKRKKKIKITYVRKHIKVTKALQEVLIPNGLDYFKDKKANMVYIGLASEIKKLKNR
jgi:hypothetical protein